MPSNTRWCPTPEQLMILEELYRRGLRTPTAQQIQRITAHLSLYGRIQGKNVFYWFQNHKARDRQKLRKRLASAATHQLLHPPPPQFQHCHFHSFQTLCGHYPQLNLPHPPQGWQEVAPARASNWRTSACLEKDWLMGGGFNRIMEVGPTSQPPQTLQLFPLTSSAQNSTSSSAS